jgi:type I restriction-modification system DNA methylase subunit
MDAVLEPTKRSVLDTKRMLDEARITEQRAALAEAAGQAFYNTSKFTLRDLKSRGSQQQLLADFEDYLNGFSPNVQDILDNFKFRNQLTTLSKADAIGTLINKFLNPDIDLSPAGIDNHLMGTVFEELVRKFNEENNEEAGEHWTPRDAVRLMANLVFLPIEKEIKSGTYLLYDCACGTGGMLTVGEETLTAIGAKRAQQVKCQLYGQEINPETYAVCKADMLLKGEGESADHIVGGAEWSTLSHDAFPAREFDFMLAKPRSDGWQGRDARPALQGDAQGRGAFTCHALQRRAIALPRQHGIEDERQVRAWQPHRRSPQWFVALHRRCWPGREQHPPLAHRERLARSHRRAATQSLLQHWHCHLHLGAVQPECC